MWATTTAGPSTAGQTASTAGHTGVRAELCRPPQQVALEIFAGCMRLSGALASQGLRLAMPIEKEVGVWCDVEDERVQTCVLQWLQTQQVWYVHLATPCTKYSRARTTGTKDLSRTPLDFTAAVLKIVHKRKLLFSLENPSHSGLFREPAIRKHLEDLGAVSLEFDACAWGANYKKSTEIRTNVPALTNLQKFCQDACGAVSAACGDVLRDVPEALSLTSASLAVSAPPRGSSPQSPSLPPL